MKRDFCDCSGSSRGVTRLDGAQGKKQVWRPHVRTWGLSEANVLFWRKYLWHCWDFMAPPQWFGTPILIRRPVNCAPLSPLVTPLCNRGHFHYCVERTKRFVNVSLHCIVSSMERISKISSLPFHGKISADACASDLNFFEFLAFFRRVLVVSYLQTQQTKNLWIIEILINHIFAIFKVSRPEAFETKMRPETFETETRKNGSRDSSRDLVSRLYH